MDIKIKELLDKFRKLPKYQLERRIDIFLVPYLEKAFSGYFKETVHFLYPEFPLQQLSIPDTIKSVSDLTKENFKNIKQSENLRDTNVDYLLASQKTVYLCELKTDSTSYKKINQLVYYIYYAEKNFSELVSFFKKKAIEKKKKWKNGFDHFNEVYDEKFGCNAQERTNLDLKVVYLGPKNIETNEEFLSMKNILNEKLDFISLRRFSEYTDDTCIKQLLIDIDKEYKN